ncbi:unnamed protein product, partial [Mesorhabditis spiculigera]
MWRPLFVCAVFALLQLSTCRYQRVGFYSMDPYELLIQGGPDAGPQSRQFDDSSSGYLIPAKRHWRMAPSVFYEPQMSPPYYDMLFSG